MQSCAALSNVANGNDADELASMNDSPTTLEKPLGCRHHLSGHWIAGRI
jgi:hypothetical protein